MEYECDNWDMSVIIGFISAISCVHTCDVVHDDGHRRISDVGWNQRPETSGGRQVSSTRVQKKRECGRICGFGCYEDKYDKQMT